MAKQVIRSAKDGQFVSSAEAKAKPHTTVTQTVGQDAHPDRFRSAADGRFVSADYAQKHPSTTIKEGAK